MAAESRRPILGFDLDGTLVDSVLDIARALNSALVEEGHPPRSVDDIRRFIGHGARQLVVEATARRDGAFSASAAPRRRESLVTDNQHSDGSVVDAVLARFRHHYSQGLVGETRAFLGIPALLQRLRPDAHIAVVTNKPGALARPLVEALLPGLVDVVIGSDDGFAHKPDPAALRAIEARLGGPVVAFVGDSDVDVDTATAHGVPAVFVGWGLRPEEGQRAHTIVHDVAGLEQVLRRLLRG